MDTETEVQRPAGHRSIAPIRRSSSRRDGRTSGARTSRGSLRRDRPYVHCWVAHALALLLLLTLLIVAGVTAVSWMDEYAAAIMSQSATGH